MIAYDCALLGCLNYIPVLKPPAALRCDVSCRVMLCRHVLSCHRSHGGVDMGVLVCNPAPSQLDPQAAAGMSVALSVVGMALLGYCGYVSWYGRWGLPKLQRVSQAVCTLRVGWELRAWLGIESVCVVGVGGNA